MHAGRDRGKGDGQDIRLPGCHGDLLLMRSVAAQRDSERVTTRRQAIQQQRRYAARAAIQHNRGTGRT